MPYTEDTPQSSKLFLGQKRSDRASPARPGQGAVQSSWKIAIDARIINSSTGRYVERLIYHLEKLDHDNNYLILVPKKDLNYYKPTNPRFTIVEADFDSYSFSEQVGFLGLLNRLKPDLVHFCMPQQPILYRGRHVTTVHDLILLNTYNSDKNYLMFKAKQLVGRAVFKIIGKTSDYILCPSHYVQKAYTNYTHIDPSKVILTYEGCDIASTKPQEYSALKNKRYILYVGQQSDYKNIRRLMQAHQALRQTHPDLLLVLVGRLSGKNGPPLVANRDWAKTQGFQGLLYTDFLPDEQLLWTLQHAQAYVFPSLMEGFGLPGLEAMAAGAPVISSNATSLPEIYGDGAHYFDPLDVSDIVRAINDVLQNPKLADELRQKGHTRVAQYSWQRMAEETLSVYNLAITRSNSGRLHDHQSD